MAMRNSTMIATITSTTSKPTASAVAVAHAESARIGEAVGVARVGSIVGLVQHKTVADATSKAVVHDAAGRPQAFVLCSAPAYPHRVARTVERAHLAADQLGCAGRAVLQPVLAGWWHDVSYAVYPWRTPLGRGAVRRRLDPRWYRRGILRWLRDAASNARPWPEDEYEGIDASLCFVHTCQALPEPIRAAAGRARQRLASGHWQPRRVVDHNDLWLANVLRASRGDRAAGNAYGLWLIDWGAVNMTGFGFYDLLHAAEELRMSPRRLRRELAAHCRCMGCPPGDAPSQLLASLGHLGRHREEFPLRRYVEVVTACWKLMDAGLRGQGQR